MFSSIYLFCVSHQVLVSAITGGVFLLLGIFIPGDKLWNAIKMAGFTTSQFIRKCFGAKAEEFADKAADAFDAGMKSDDTKVPPEQKK
jgi:hypothetical protein